MPVAHLVQGEMHFGFLLDKKKHLSISGKTQLATQPLEYWGN